MIPLALYIHIPWCIRKCPYCDFNSHKSPNGLPEQNYIQALIHDLKADIEMVSGRTIQSIFIGGGTPSLFSAKAYAQLFEALQTLLDFENDIEITLEANPGTVEQQRFRDYRALGINRLSLGIQSFHTDHLNVLGRIHDAEQAKKAINSARLAGFENINLDLMHSLPNQSVEEGLKDLKTALHFEPEHLSWYQLTIEPNTVFYKKNPTLPSEDTCLSLEEAGLELLNKSGYTRYEISAFCKPDKPSQHNLNYWLFGDYLGIGAGAHGKLTTPDFTVWRTRKHRQPNDYLAFEKSFCPEKKRVTLDDLIFEFMLNTSRLQQPIPFDLFTQRTGLSSEQLVPKLKQAESKGFIQIQKKAWQVTSLGRRFTNDLQALFLSD
ncbi:radical SAM family heme chaperone HemW [Legionella impletisoli]|uniref:Heme chaperone HemW n=1 Tax=Legionella impletisoli TaxID=343510 RepID=A0A917JWS9_9GAMM|nr:radical SAM family heme chaperone HemW [Legionella impletisoli]GGI86467.1 YggW family oxidoreductase [Legionella impletisoli]